MINLILCGGAGSRLWPVCRRLMPKHFYPLINGKSLFEKTVERNRDICDSVMLAVHKDQFFLAAEQLVGMEVEKSRGILEPVGRNTAPAIALACMMCDPEDVIFVSPSDHLISNMEEYRRAVNRACELAKEGFIVTVGIKPSFPETGFGYIEAEGEDVLSFREKPNLAMAQEYLSRDNYFWNSGQFCFKAGVLLKELKLHCPQIYEACHIAFQEYGKEDHFQPGPELMLNIPSMSIDYAVMEKSRKMKMVSTKMGWSDLGSFDSLYYQTYSLSKENAVVGDDNSILINSTKNLIMSNKRKVACVDVQDLIIVDSEDALLVAKRGSSQKVKEVVATLSLGNSTLLDAPVTVKRPWGCYSVLQDSSGYKVKRLEVLPGKRLSLQKHCKRQEHWTVVEGIARVTLNKEEITLSRNQSTYIPAGALHRLENGGQENLVVIETQVGSYLGEDDIIRIEDDWNRS